MKVAPILIAFVALVALAAALPAKGSTKASLRNNKPCLSDCTDNYKPVCAGDGTGKNRSFGSECVLNNHNCENGSNLRVVSQGECPGGGGIRLS